VAAVPVQVHDLYATQVHSAGPEDVRLDSRVDQMLLSNTNAGSDFDERPAVTAALEYVSLHHDSTGGEGGLIQSGHSSLHGRRSGFNPCAPTLKPEINEVATR
jgi:hypothetical protein